MLVENAEAATQRGFLSSRREGEPDARAEALERGVCVEAIYRTERRKSRIELLRLLGQIHSGIERTLHRRDQPVFLLRNRHELVTDAQIESEGWTHVPVILEIRTEQDLLHVP